MSDPTERRDEESIEDVVRGTVGDHDSETTRREALELELEARGRSDEGVEVEVTEIVDD